MNTKTEKQIADIKSQTIGVEIEMNNITRMNAAKLAAEYFGTHRYADTHRINGYFTWSAWDAQGREWKFQRDVSIAGDDAHKCEMVTPILTYADIETLQELCRKLRRAVEPAFIAAVNEKKPATLPELADVWYQANGASYGRDAHYNPSRYHMLNLHATFTKGTVEFRLFQFDAPADGKQNGIHAGQLKSYIQLCLALSAMAKSVRSASFKPQQNENPKYAMRTWLLRLGFIGDEFATARDILTRNLSGDAAFRYGRAA